MLLQTNSYIVPQEKRAEHARLMRRFRQVLTKVGCDNFEVYEQVGANWGNAPTTGRFVQIMRFRDRRHQVAVQNAERTDPAAQQLIAEFCELINYPYQQQQQQFAVGFYASALPIAPLRGPHVEDATAAEGEEPSPLESEAPVTDAAAAESEAFTEIPAEAPLAENEPEAITDEVVDTNPVEQPIVEDDINPEHFEPELTEESALESEESLVDEPLAEKAAIAPSQSIADETTEDFFADDDTELNDHADAEHPLAEPTETHAVSDQPASGEKSPATGPSHAAAAQDDLDLETELDIGQDDISRLAEELAAGDAQLDDSRRTDSSSRHRPGRASGNGAH
jgi:hypothetical protein